MYVLFGYGWKELSGRHSSRANDFYSQLADWETEWITTPKHYGKILHPDEVSTVKAAFEKWST